MQGKEVLHNYKNKPRQGLVANEKTVVSGS
jgi:hypothetical protein